MKRVAKSDVQVDRNKVSDLALPNLTDLETLQLGATMYLNLDGEEEVEYDLDDGFVDDGYEDYNGGNKDRDSVNGKWDRKDTFGFEGDDDFDNLFRKKGRKKIGKWFKKSVKKVKKATKKLSLKNIGKGIKKIGKGIVKGIKAVGKLIVKATMVIPRNAYLLLMRVNFRGLATKSAVAQRGGASYKKAWKKVCSKWEKLGGRCSALTKAINKGKNKKPLLCGKKCKSKIAKKVGKSFTGADGTTQYELDRRKFNKAILQMNAESISEKEYDNVFFTASMGVAVGSATAIIGTMAGILSGIKGNKIQEKAMKDSQKETNRQNKEFEKQSSEKTKQELKLAEQQIQSQANPRNSILNNPALSNAEKKSALAVLDNALAVEDGRKSKKWMLYAGAGLVGLLVLWGIVKSAGGK